VIEFILKRNSLIKVDVRYILYLVTEQLVQQTFYLKLKLQLYVRSKKDYKGISARLPVGNCSEGITVFRQYLMAWLGIVDSKLNSVKR
jgi:hypothetical protein